MVITDNKSLNYSKKTRLKTNIRFLILHYTGMQSARVSLNRLTNPKSKVSCHYLIDRNGKVIKLVEDIKTAWHAGVSSWCGRQQCNASSIGVELEGSDDTRYEELQYNALITLIAVLRNHYPSIQADAIVGHSDIAPGRKTDPGPSFDWSRVRHAVQ